MLKDKDGDIPNESELEDVESEFILDTSCPLSSIEAIALVVTILVGRLVKMHTKSVSHHRMLW